MDETLVVTVSPDGSGIRVETSGIQGPVCTSLTESFERLGQVTRREKKSEYFLDDIIPVQVEE